MFASGVSDQSLFSQGGDTGSNPVGAANSLLRACEAIRVSTPRKGGDTLWPPAQLRGRKATGPLRGGRGSSRQPPLLCLIGDQAAAFVRARQSPTQGITGIDMGALTALTSVRSGSLEMSSSVLFRNVEEIPRLLSDIGWVRGKRGVSAPLDIGTFRTGGSRHAALGEIDRGPAIRSPGASLGQSTVIQGRGFGAMGAF
jgi:hypothetical protein